MTGLLTAVVVSAIRDSRQFEREHEWVRDAVRQLQLATSPSAGAGQNSSDRPWITPEHLLFTNGWAAYKFHTMHDGGGIGDVGVMRFSNGDLYVSRMHFCTGIGTSLAMRNEGKELCPESEADFLKNYGQFQEWNSLSPDGRLLCVVLSHDRNRGGSKKSEKKFRVWIGGTDVGTQSVESERRYAVTGYYVSWHTRWTSNHAVAVDVFDYGPQGSPTGYAGREDHAALMRSHSNHLMTVPFRLDPKTGRFVESR